MRSLIGNISNLFKTKKKTGLTVITGGNLDITKKLIEKIFNKENTEIIILYNDYDISKDDYYINLENKINEENLRIKKNNINLSRIIQVFNCDLSIQDDKEEFIYFLSNNKKKVKLFLF